MRSICCYIIVHVVSITVTSIMKEHRPPMFALPPYLQEHVCLLRLLGVREAMELPSSSISIIITTIMFIVSISNINMCY